MRNKIALFLAAILFFNIILPSKVFASSVQDQSKPIFGLTADQVVEKYNQLSDQQKDQVLRSLGNTSIFANSLFGNIFNSTFGVLEDSVKKLGDLFFKANGVVYKLGSSALAWVSRLIDKVFNNDLNDFNISQPVIDDFYIYTRDLQVNGNPFFRVPNKPTNLNNDQMYNAVFPTPVNDYDYIYRFYNSGTSYIGLYKFQDFTYSGKNCLFGIYVNYGARQVGFGPIAYTVDSSGNYVLDQFLGDRACVQYGLNQYSNSWQNYNGVRVLTSGVGLYNYYYTNDYFSTLLNMLNQNFVYAKYFYLFKDGILTRIDIDTQGDLINITNNTYYNYIYNIPDQTPLNINNIVSNTAINYDPVENLIQYLPDNYNIEQNFSVVNNYYISSGSAITGQAIDVNIVSPGVIDVRVINPEDLTQQVTNNVSKDIINNTDVNFGDLDFSPSVTVGLNAAKDSIEGIVPVTGSSIVAQFVSGIPPDWLALGFVFLILFIVAGFGMSIIRH